MIGVSGMAMRLFRALAQAQVNVILITQASSEHTICVAVNPSQSSDAEAAIREEFSYELRAALIDPPIVDNEYAIVSVVGDGMRNTPGVAATLCHSLAENGVNIAAIAQGSSERNISVVIRRLDQRKALNAIHDRFFLSHLRTLNVFVVGHGLIGRTLLDQIQEYRESLHRDHHVELTIVGLTNSSRMIIDEEGISPDNAEELLNSIGTPADLQAFVHRMIQLNLPHSVFVDCTASAEVPHWYHTVLSRHIAVVTPNKKGQSGPLLAYKLIKEAAKLPGSRFLFETSVGAGLPVIGTLNDLLRSGDSIRTIDAVLSGTLSYLFNTLVPGRPMSELIRDARDKGYTEPDPRDDLSGLDVARKLLILAREAGFELELDDIKIENLVPEPLRELATAEEFLRGLKDYDEAFEKLVSSAHEEGKRLRYIAQFDGTSASVSLQAVDRNHPFFSLSGSDNILAFTTERYHSSPLVIQGPGAGAAVTAAGVFADIVRVALAG
jgi:aspartokinase/homoserine dehydrogenase 1